MDHLRTGIKFGLAGLLAVHASLVLRLDDPTWALITVFVLMITPFVGAIAEKAVLRVIGTVVGGTVGYLLLGSLQQEPLIFLPAVGLFVAVTVALFGQSHSPYAFLLAGLTAVVVISHGSANPADSWKIALVRTEEITVGILATLLVSLLVWPRYARAEFQKKLRAAFADLAECFDENRPTLHHGATAAARQRVGEFPLRLSGLRALLQSGRRESRYFGRRIDVYSELVSAISRIAGSIRTLGEPLPDQSFYRGKVDAELKILHAALLAALTHLSQPSASTSAEDREALHAANDQFQTRVRDLRRHPEAPTANATETFVFGVHSLALEEILHRILRIHELLDSLSSHQPQPPPTTIRVSKIKNRDFIPPLFWIRNGIKGGLAVVIALVIQDWLQPPGGTLTVLATFVFTVLNPASPGGGGDHRAFHYVALYVAVLALACLGLLALAPLLSDYAVLLVFLFTALVLWGGSFPLGSGISLPHQIAMLLIASAVGLNAQVPVPFEHIVGVFVGISLALVISATIQRVLWPSLPQRTLRDRLAEYVGHCRHLVRAGADEVPLTDRIRMALIPAEARKCLTLLGRSPLSSVDATLLADYLERLRAVATDLFACARRLAPLLPAPVADEGRTLVGRLDEALDDLFREQHETLAESRPHPERTAALAPLLAEWERWSLALRAWVLANDPPVSDAIRLLGYAGRYQQATRDLIAADALLRQVDVRRLTADYSL
jgi:uncharacterized membrane protein YccC